MSNAAKKPDTKKPESKPPWTSGRVVGARKMTLFGEQSSGKTYFAGSDENSLILSVDSGADELDHVDKWRGLDTPEKIKDAVDWLLKEKHSIKWIGLDTVTALMRGIEDRIVAETEGATSISCNKTLAYGLGYIKASAVFADVLSKLDELHAKKKINIMLICHERLGTVDDPDCTEDYKRKVPQVHWRINKILEDWSTECLWFGRNINIEGSESSNKRAVADEFRIYCTNTPGHMAKNRLGLDASIERDWKKFKEALIKYMKGE